MRLSSWIYTELDRIGFRDTKLSQCAVCMDSKLASINFVNATKEQCLDGRTTQCKDIYAHCVCESHEYVSSVRQCIANQCDAITQHKSDIFINHICDRKLTIQSSKSATSFQFISYISRRSSDIFVGLHGWVRLPLENSIIHDFDNSISTIWNMTRPSIKDSIKERALPQYSQHSFPCPQHLPLPELVL
jgi:hypothetical protein